MSTTKIAPPQQDSSNEGANSRRPPKELSTLFESEIFWRDHQEWLEENGYLLRPRLRPGWVPSWQGSKKHRIECEDGLPLIGPLMDATRLADGSVVAIKRVYKHISPEEIGITQYLTHSSLTSDTRNHCVPFYEMLQSPLDDNVVFLVLPFLRAWNKPRFCTIGEAVDCIKQLIEGLQYIHEHRVAHRDIHCLNIMMDPRPLVSEMYHPKNPRKSYDFRRNVSWATRTAAPTKYYYVDFGISCQYPTDCVHPLEYRTWGGDRSVPEFQRSEGPFDPFPTDIYYLGSVIREEFTNRCYGFEFLMPLVADMVQDEPLKRPTIDEVAARFEEIRSRLGTWKLRSRIVRKKDSPILGFFRAMRHAYRTAWYVATFTPAIPTPRS